MEEDYIFKTLTISFAFLLLYVMVKLVHNFWWRPKSIEKILRQQGIKGTSYRVLTSDLPEMMKCAKEASSKPMNLNHQIVPRVMPFLHKMVQQYGEISLFWFGRLPVLIIRDAELAKFILTNKNGHFIKSRRNPLMNLLQLGVATLEGEQWSKRRKLVASAFLLEKLKAMVPAFSSSCCSLIERWKGLVKPQGSCEVDVAQEFNVLTGDVIARTAFGSNYEEGKKIFELQNEQALLMREASNSIYIPGFRFIPTKKNKKRYHLYNQIKAILQDMIQKKEHTMKTSTLQGHDDLLSLLLKCKEENKNSLTIEDVIEECKLFYFAGQETTSNLLTWTMVVLSMHTSWQEKAREEVLEICSKETPNLEAISRLKIVSMILNEVLRLYPPVPSLRRYTQCDTRVGSISIPAGVELRLPFMLLHYDTKYWDKPEEFNPERFSEGISKASKDQVAFYSFSWGPRICLGQNFAYIEAKMALAMILQHFSFQLSPSYAHAPHDRVTLKPQHGAPIIIHRI